MSPLAAAFAKLAGIRKAVAQALDDEFGRKGQRPYQNFPVKEVGSYFTGARDSLAVLQENLPELYGDFDLGGIVPEVEMGHPPGEKEDDKWRYSRAQMQKLARDVEQLLEIRSHSELATPELESPRRVFISHGRAQDWRAIQAYIEKDIGLSTLELAQEANEGRTIFAKLVELSGKCDSAVIVMTGDDQDADGKARARENVIHEIGFFHGRYGAKRVCLLHEEGVSVPSNIHGIVYTPFPKGGIEATFGLVVRELRVMYGLK